LFPDVPSCNDEDFHEEGMVEVLPSHFHHLEERDSYLPLDSYTLPAFQCKRTAEEQVKSSFFSLCWTKDTAVIVALNLESFPL
jgi:hypothetical protein